MLTIAPSLRLRNLIIIVSILIPVVVAVLIYLPQSARLSDLDVSFLPHLNALLNSATALALIVSLVAIKRGNRVLHQLANQSAILLSVLFLVCYVVYHYTAPSTMYGDGNGDKVLDSAEAMAVAGTRSIYLVLLLSHIVLATVVIPFVLFSTYFSLSGQFEKHKKLSRFTWPIWFYVAATGVIVYWFISPYYLQN